MKIYDRLAGKLGLSPSKVLSREETLRRIPTLEPSGLQRGVEYYDGEVDYSRLAVNLAQTIFDLGGAAVNYMPVSALIKEEDLIVGATVLDLESGKENTVRAKAVVNATGVFTDSIRKMDEPEAKSIVAASQGSHDRMPKSFLPGSSAIMVPHTPDGRVLFAVPWHDHVVVGTTDVPVDNIQREPTPMDEEIGFILTNAAKDPIEGSNAQGRTERLCRIATAGEGGRRKKHGGALAGPHHFDFEFGPAHDRGRQVDDISQDGGGCGRSGTNDGRFGRAPMQDGAYADSWLDKQAIESPSLGVYGADAQAIQELAAAEPALAEKIHPELPYIRAEVVWAVREEMARNVEDVLSRRTRGLLLGARASIEAAPGVADLIARELGRDEAWKKKAVEDYRKVAQGYVLQDG